MFSQKFDSFHPVRRPRQNKAHSVIYEVTSIIKEAPRRLNQRSLFYLSARDKTALFFILFLILLLRNLLLSGVHSARGQPFKCHVVVFPRSVSSNLGAACIWMNAEMEYTVSIWLRGPFDKRRRYSRMTAGSSAARCRSRGRPRRPTSSWNFKQSWAPGGRNRRLTHHHHHRRTRALTQPDSSPPVPYSVNKMFIGCFTFSIYLFAFKQHEIQPQLIPSRVDSMSFISFPLAPGRLESPLFFWRRSIIARVKASRGHAIKPILTAYNYV